MSNLKDMKDMNHDESQNTQNSVSNLSENSGNFQTSRKIPSNIFSQLTSPQIQQLQAQIRRFKDLGKRYAESGIPKTLPENTPPPAPASLPPPEPPKPAETKHVPPPPTVVVPVLSPHPVQELPRIWRPLSTIYYTGPRQLIEGMVSAPTSEYACYDAAPVDSTVNQPLMMTRLFASTLREFALSKLVNKGVTQMESKMTTTSISSPLSSSSVELFNKILHDRQSKAAILNNFVSVSMSISSNLQIQNSSGNGSLSSSSMSLSTSVSDEALNNTAYTANTTTINNDQHYLTKVTPWRNYVRLTKAFKKDQRLIEREEKRRRMEVEDKRKKKMAEYHRALASHRDEFYRFHKMKKIECAKTARATKTFLELAESKKEKEDAKAEAKRMQALKENDMEAYTKLLQDTKNDRLHFLVSQTDSYIATINEMVLKSSAAGSNGNSNNSATAEIDTGATTDDSSSSKVTESSTTSLTFPNKISGTNSSTTTSTAIVTSASKPTTTSSSSSSRNDYYATAHRKIEIVSQPRSLAGGDLKEYQLSGVQWMVSLYNNNLNGILADEMGLGKTIQTIGLLAYLMEHKNNLGPYMVVVPLSTLSNWVNEFSKWAPHMIKVVYKGVPTIRKQLFKEVEPGTFNVLLTTYEYTMKDKGYLRRLDWQYIIVDEGHRMKNAESKFAQTLGTFYSSKHRLLLTGTPLQNNLPELWALLNFLLPAIFNSMETFDQWFNRPFASFKNPNATSSSSSQQNSDSTSGSGEQEVTSLTQEEKMLIVNRLHEVIRPFMLRRVKDQVLDQLPEKVEKIIRCSLSGFQKKIYQAIHTRSIASKIKDGGSGSIDDLENYGVDSNTSNNGKSSGLNNAIMQLRKVCNHPYLFLSEWYMDDDLVRCSGKFELLDRMLPKLQKAGHRVLMFSQMTQVMTILERFFDMRGFCHLRLDGSTPSDEREKRMYMFNDPDSPYFIFLLSTRAGGLGLNLATADTVILFDSDWNPMMDAQAQDRAHRIGQKNEVRVFRLVSTSPVEERILARATDKRNLTGLVVEAGKFNVQGGARGGASSGSGANGSGNSNKHYDVDKDKLVESYLKEMSMSGTAAMSSSSSSSGVGNNCIIGEDGEGGVGTELEEGEEDEGLLEVPDDDQINEMMAINESEMNLYKAMDQQRLLQRRTSASARGRSVPLPALMGADEQPVWLQPYHWTSKNSLLLECINQDAATAAAATISNQYQYDNYEDVVDISGVGGNGAGAGSKQSGRKKKSQSLGGLSSSNNNSGNGNGSTIGGFQSSQLKSAQSQSFAYNTNNNTQITSSLLSTTTTTTTAKTSKGVLLGGKLMRKRKNDVTYDDGLTELQFMRRMEAQAKKEEKDVANATAAYKKSTADGAVARMNKKNKLSMSGIIGGCNQSAEFFHQNILSNMYLYHTFSKQFQSPTDYTNSERIVQHVGNILSSDGTRSASFLFLNKPDKKLYPDYYELIDEPLSLKEILANVKKNSYKCFLEIEYDFAVMSCNARTYNSEVSYVFTDAELIRKTFYEWCCRYDVIDKTICMKITAGDIVIPPPLPSSFNQLKQSFLQSHSVISSMKNQEAVNAFAQSTDYQSMLAATALSSSSSSAQDDINQQQSSSSESAIQQTSSSNTTTTTPKDKIKVGRKRKNKSLSPTDTNTSNNNTSTSTTKKKDKIKNTTTKPPPLYASLSSSSSPNINTNTTSAIKKKSANKNNNTTSNDNSDVKSVSDRFFDENDDDYNYDFDDQPNSARSNVSTNSVGGRVSGQQPQERLVLTFKRK